MCPSCLSLLTEDKFSVLEAVCTLWNLYMKIEKDSNLFAQFLKAPSRRILVTLAMLIFESQEVEFWRNTCSFCDTSGWEYLKTIIRITANCILSDKVNNLNSLGVSHQEDSRLLKKNKST